MQLAIIFAILVIVAFSGGCVGWFLAKWKIKIRRVEIDEAGRVIRFKNRMDASALKVDGIEDHIIPPARKLKGL